MSLPTETPAYKKLQVEVNATKQLLFSDRDKVVDFEITQLDGSKLTLHFRRLKSTEWSDVTGAVHKVGLVTETDFSKATKEQLDQLYACYCLALGYGSADNMNAQDWLELNDKRLVEECYYKLLDISGVSKTALENLSWFRGQWRRQNEVSGVSEDG